MQLEVSGILVFNTKRWLFSVPFENWNACTYPQRGNVIVEAPFPSLLVSNLRHIRGNCNRFCICFINVWEKFLLYLNILLIIFFSSQYSNKTISWTVSRHLYARRLQLHLQPYVSLHPPSLRAEQLRLIKLYGLKITSQSSQNKLIKFMDPLLYLIYLTRKIWRNFKATSLGILLGSKLENKK